MKKSFTLLMAFAIVLQTSASTAPASSSAKPRPLKASEVFIPIAKGTTITLEELAYMKPRDYSTLTGKKMSFFDRVGFTVAQKKLRNSINADGTINSKKMEKQFRKATEGEGFHLGGFSLGFFFLGLGVLIAYLLNDEKKKTRVKWSWIGLGAGIVFWLLLAAVL